MRHRFLILSGVIFVVILSKITFDYSSNLTM